MRKEDIQNAPEKLRTVAKEIEDFLIKSLDTINKRKSQPKLEL